jgi:hypothetical protein
MLYFPGGAFGHGGITSAEAESLRYPASQYAVGRNGYQFIPLHLAINHADHAVCGSSQSKKATVPWANTAWHKRCPKMFLEVKNYEEVSVITSRGARSDRMDADASQGRSTF